MEPFQEPVRVLPSDPIYEKINVLMHLLGVATSPERWFDVKEIHSAEQAGYIVDLKHKIHELLKEVPPTAFQGPDELDTV